ncbi:MAG TPA: M23 family metallopeptidase [Anaerolineaceae bacterium]|nr:M23 family metallopeptidase [Anaerolineaceae bacterium]
MLVAGGILAGWYFFLRPSSSGGRAGRVVSFIRNPAEYTDWVISAGARCGAAPFQFPTDGFVGFLWDDSFRPGHRHQGIDIFGGAQPGLTAVYAAYDGYLTRLPDWKSTVIIRIPDDPLQPGRQIWTYYTHLADEKGNAFISPDFPPDTAEQFVPAGTLLGYQGNYSGTPGSPTGVHLHFSIVLDDGQGKFLNELEITNTLDPSPYFSLDLNARQNPDQIPLCQSDSAEVSP